MPYNGAGTFVRLFNWAQDQVNSIKILANRMDAEFDGISTGLSTAITRDGQSTISADIPFNGKKITNLGLATADGDALSRLAGDNRYGKGGHGRVQLVLNAGNLELRPSGGNGLIVNGKPKMLPASTLTLGPSGLTQGAVYYIYAHDDNGDGVIDAIIASTTGHSTGATTNNEGVEIMAGNPDRTLVGMALVSSASTAWVTTDGGVLNWFNRKPRRYQYVLPSNQSTLADTNWRLLTTLTALQWADDTPVLETTGRLTAGSGPVGGVVCVAIGSEVAGADATGGGTIHAAAYSAGYATKRRVPGVSEGKFDAKLYAQSTNGTIVSVQAGSEMTVTVMG